VYGVFFFFYIRVLLIMSHFKKKLTRFYLYNSYIPQKLEELTEDSCHEQP
jgi:hypothetical protein